MRVFLSFLILTLSFCHVKQKESSLSQDSEKKIPGMLLLKVTYFEGEVSIIRDNVEIKAAQDLELEKEDLIKTGSNGSIELLLGIEDSIKLANNSEISVTNLLTLEGETATHISVNLGKVLTIISKDQKENLFTLITPNALTQIDGSILLTQVIPKDLKTKPTLCDKTSCITKLNLVDGNALIKIAGSPSELKLEKNNLISISDEKELVPNMVLPLDKNSFPEIKNMLSFQNNEQKIESKILEEFSSSPVTNQVPIKKSNALVAEKKKVTVTQIKKQTILPKQKSTTTKKTYSKDLNRDKLKLDSNKKF